MLGAIFGPNTLSVTELCLDCCGPQPVVDKTAQSQAVSEVLQSGNWGAPDEDRCAYKKNVFQDTAKSHHEAGCLPNLLTVSIN